MPCDNEVNRICWPAKAVGNIMDLFQRRANLHHDVYQHPTVTGVDLILRDAFVKASPHLQVRCRDGEFRSLKEASGDPVAFSRVTNWLHQYIQFGRHVKLNVDWDHPDMLEATRLLENISNRQLFKIAGIFTERYPGQRDLTKSAEEIAALTGGQVKPEEIECRSRKISWGMKDKNPMENIRFYAEKGSMRLSRTEFPNMLPRAFEDAETIVFLKSQDQSKRQATKAALDEWLQQQPECDRPSDASPMKVGPPTPRCNTQKKLPSNRAQLKRVFSLITPSYETPSKQPVENRARRVKLEK
ncbi:SAM domain and HD [Perkinsus olseni]|uniref:SAM domain and HD n=1 Tax=Perkinsus olseni TaxID=32597 RepID=A0A7J6KXT9_PEROL|nr:SAM domain and HD [Perkinsus olseni]